MFSAYVKWLSKMWPNSWYLKSPRCTNRCIVPWSVESVDPSSSFDDFLRSLKGSKCSVVSPSEFLSRAIILTAICWKGQTVDVYFWWRHECMWRLPLVWLLCQTSSWRLPESQRDLKYYIMLIWNLNNDRPPACKLENFLTINCKFILLCLSQSCKYPVVELYRFKLLVSFVV